jgi:16S rRNA (uracil1498-N3)-methyltransferase
LPRNTAPRFFIDAPLAAGATIALPPAVDHHARRVLRLREGDAITCFNGRGGEYAVRLLDDGRAAIDAFDPVERESPLDLTLIQALIAEDKLAWVIEKAVELGVTRILIAPAKRGVVRLGADRLGKRLARWNDIVMSACCQCGRNRLPGAAFASNLPDALACVDAQQKFVLAPEAAVALASATTQPTAIAIGPEGGFTADEIECAQQAGFVPASFGPRILRTETAGLAAIAALQMRHGDAGNTATGTPF